MTAAASFATVLATIPFAPTQADAKGFLPPLVRALGHMTYVLADCAAAETDATKRILDDPRALTELKHAAAHWKASNANDALTATTATAIANLGKALDAAIKEYPDWTNPDRIRNLRDLGNRAAAISAILDRELVGLKDSDAGFSL